MNKLYKDSICKLTIYSNEFEFKVSIYFKYVNDVNLHEELCLMCEDVIFNTKISDWSFYYCVDNESEHYTFNIFRDPESIDFINQRLKFHRIINGEFDTKELNFELKKL